jgi:hypothetical protein
VLEEVGSHCYGHVACAKVGGGGDMEKGQQRSFERLDAASAQRVGGSAVWAAAESA